MNGKSELFKLHGYKEHSIDGSIVQVNETVVEKVRSENPVLEMIVECLVGSVSEEIKENNRWGINKKMRGKYIRFSEEELAQLRKSIKRIQDGMIQWVQDGITRHLRVDLVRPAERVKFLENIDGGYADFRDYLFSMAAIWTLRELGVKEDFTLSKKYKENCIEIIQNKYCTESIDREITRFINTYPNSRFIKSSDLEDRITSNHQASSAYTPKA